MNKCDVSLPFTAHVHSDNSERLKAYGKKGNVKQLNLRKTNEKNIPPLLPGLAALEVVFIVVNDYKITNTYEEIRSSHRHFKKWSLFKVDSNIKCWRGSGSESMPTVTANTWERDDTKKTRHAPPVPCVKNANERTKTGAPMKTNKTATHLGWYTPDKIIEQI